VKEYLWTVLSAADHLKGLEATHPLLQEAFSRLVTLRLDATDKNLSPDTSGRPGVVAEQEAYNKYLQPYRKEEFIGLIGLQDKLLERKYFQTQTAKNANYLEGIVNGYWSLTRADQSDPKKVLAQPHLGVSPWEAIFRLEPALAFHDGTQPAILGTAGLSYAFFPEIDFQKAPVDFHESFQSKWIKKTGGRVGIGVGRKESKTHLLTGIGMQINAVAVWVIYQPDDQIWMLGLSASDLSKIKKVLPFFD
jgi:hypothetical protein